MGESDKEFEPPAYEYLFVCHFGTERSRRISRAYGQTKHFTGYFDGGTKKMSRMNEKDLQIQIHPSTMVSIIYEEGSRVDEYNAYKETLKRLERAGIQHETLNIAEVMMRLRVERVELSDYL